MPVIRRRGLAHHPRLIQRLQHLLRQGPLLGVLQVPLQLLQAAHTDDDAVAALAAGFHVQGGVVRQPAQGGLDHGEVVFGDDGFDDAEGVEGGVFEVAVAAEGEIGVSMTDGH